MTGGPLSCIGVAYGAQGPVCVAFREWLQRQAAGAGSIDARLAADVLAQYPQLRAATTLTVRKDGRATTTNTRRES